MLFHHQKFLYFGALHKSQVDWCTRSLHFETPQHEALECETLINMQNLKQKENLNSFFIYALPSLDVEPCAHEIPSQYQEFEDVCVWEKNYGHLV